jgi:hypothetical protein
MKRLAKIQRDLKAPKDQQGYGFMYRKASDILQAVKPLLKEDNLTILLNDRVEEIGGKYFLVADAGLYADDGKEIAKTSAFAVMDSHKGMSTEQATGAASSYARKYALCGLLAIDDSSNDPDGLEPKKEQTIDKAVDEMNAASTIKEAQDVWKKYPQYQNYVELIEAKEEKKKSLTK